MKQGFTLIELLVVVLIIGILAAIALPQYTKAVEKARAAEAIQMLGDLATAEQIYFMSAGTYTDDLTLLDIEMSGIDNSDSSKAKTKNFQLEITAPDGSGTTFVAAASRIDSTGAVINTGNQKYAVNIGLTAGGQISRWCTETAQSSIPGSMPTSGATDTCKSIAGNAGGVIK